MPSRATIASVAVQAKGIKAQCSHPLYTLVEAIPECVCRHENGPTEPFAQVTIGVPDIIALKAQTICLEATSAGLTIKGIASRMPLDGSCRSPKRALVGLSHRADDMERIWSCGCRKSGSLFLRLLADAGSVHRSFPRNFMDEQIRGTNSSAVKKRFRKM